MPIIPHLTDNIENLDAIFKLSKENGAKSIIPQVLHLRGSTKKTFLNHIQTLFPELVDKIKSLYSGSYANKEYLENFRGKIQQLRMKYDFYNKLEKARACKKQEIQLKLI